MFYKKYKPEEQKNDKGWEEFDKKYRYYEIHPLHKENIKEFISNLLEKAREEERERIVEELLNQEECIFLNIQREFIKKKVNER